MHGYPISHVSYARTSYFSVIVAPLIVFPLRMFEDRGDLLKDYLCFLVFFVCFPIYRGKIVCTSATSFSKGSQTSANKIFWGKKLVYVGWFNEAEICAFVKVLF